LSSYFFDDLVFLWVSIGEQKLKYGICKHLKEATAGEPETLSIFLGELFGKIIWEIFIVETIDGILNGVFPEA
jgi:hypothetical protein